MSDQPRHSGAVMLMGMPIDAIDEASCVQLVLDSLARGAGGWMITANLDHLRRFQADPEYRDFCDDADLVVADGRPMLWAARLRGTPLPAQVAGSNLIYSLSEGAAKRGCSVFFLGGDPGTAEKASAILHQRYGLRIAGVFFPDFGFEKDAAQVKAMTDAIRESEADIVYVALGSPKQERLIAQYKSLLPRAWWIGVGISFSFVCGETRRAPRWMQVSGLEWSHRLVREPRRLFKRYITQGIPFAGKLMLHSLVARFRRGKTAATVAGSAGRA